jgi:transglutaminase-like putative cysteine protease
MLFCVLLCGCGESADAADSSGQTVPRYNTTLDASSPEETSKTDYVGKRDSTPEVLEPAADGTTVYSNDYAAIDASHTDQGYVMAQYTGDCPKVKLQVIGPGKDETYTYLMKPDNSWQTFPFSCGDGNYTVRILENVEGSSYAISLTQELSVSLENEFLPFLYPNQYVSFDKNSLAVEKGASLAKSADTDLDAVSNIYHYVIENITYDTEKAETVQYGYTPDVDDTLESGTGICFDYAALMTTMLRTQRIPTRLDVGYSGEAYHAWISTYIEDVGWIDDIIEFDGKSWKLMDPTLAANNNSSAVGKYIGDGTNYTLKYSY